MAAAVTTTLSPDGEPSAACPCTCEGLFVKAGHVGVPQNVSDAGVIEIAYRSNRSVSAGAHRGRPPSGAPADWSGQERGLRFLHSC
jgi:hypothetical protein